MRPVAHLLMSAMLLVAIAGSGRAMAGESYPQFGCYKLAHKAEHLRARQRQLVRKVALEIERLRPEQLASGRGELVANADLRMWARGAKRAFSTYAVCRERAGGYDCLGHDLANEHRHCELSTPGVHGCRAPARADKFRLDPRHDGLLVTIPDALELSVSDTGPYLNLVSSDRANSAFLLRPEKSCR